jgi:hypothetical protein
MSDSIMNLNLPYQTQSNHTFREQLVNEAIENSKQAVSLTSNFPKQMRELAKQDADEILSAFVENVTAIPGYQAACLMIVGTHGNEFQDVVLQVEGGLFVRQKWNDSSKNIKVEKDVEVNLDLREELHQLRRENWKLRSAGDSNNRNIDRKSGMEGRYITLYIAAGLESEWLMCRNLLLNGEYSNNALNRILRVMGNLEEKVALV